MLTQSQSKLLLQGARRLGVELAEEHLARFATYLEELARWSKIADLVSQTDPEVIIRKHILDSLAVSPLIAAESQVLDLGSGAGFPGLVLAIVQPARTVVLLESRRKKVNFLKEAVRKTKTTNVKIYEGRVEALASEKFLQNSFDVVITRATWSVKDFLRFAAPFVVPGGTVIAMKGPGAEKELSELAFCFTDLGFHLKKTYEYILPFGKEKRQAVIFTKNVSHDT
jgi:16S rRNA (guanine527-N7)-methyltransferase